MNFSFSDLNRNGSGEKYIFEKPKEVSIMLIDEQ
jgi:hypothetical protein